MEPDGKKIKFTTSETDVHEEAESNLVDYTETIPKEIMTEIFKKASKSENFVSNISLVCKRWNEILSTEYLFNECTYFMEVGNINQHELFLKSVRKFKKITFWADPRIARFIDCFFNVVERSFNYLTEVNLDFGANNCTETYLYSILKSIRLIKILKLEFVDTEMISDGLEWQQIEFPKLQKFKVDVNSDDFYIITKFMKFLNVPALQKFDCYMRKTLFPICENIFTMLNQEMDLKDINLSFGGGPKFTLKDGRLEIIQCDDIKRELMNFLQQRQRTMSVHVVDICSYEDDLHAFILRNCLNMKEINTDVNFEELILEKFVLPYVEKVQLWFFDVDHENILRLSEMFPNVKEMTLQHPHEMSPDFGVLIRILFQRLEKAQHIDFDDGRVDF